MKKLSIIVIKDCIESKVDYNDYEILFTNEEQLLNTVTCASGKYIVFSREEDNIDNNYLSTILHKCSLNFDYCFINYIVDVGAVNEIKINTQIDELKNLKPYFGEYIWSYIFDKEKFIDVCSIIGKDDFNKKVDEIFLVGDAIGNIIYNHSPINQHIHNFVYCDIKETIKFDNIIFIEKGCAGVFNGYVSWLRNIGKCFGKKFNITLIYNNIFPNLLNEFSNYFNCVEYSNNKNYVCDRLFVCYNCYYYPKNIIYTDENYLFIHGNMSDYEHARRYSDDLYTKYIGVSETAAKKAIGYYPTKNIEYVINPFKLDKKLVKPHLKLVSAQRWSPEKKPERIEILASVLDELEIPYTWNVFTDTNENTNKNGVIYRKRVSNPLPYFADSDYFVLLSDTESLSYAVIEALSVNTKVLVTPQDAYKEFGVEDGKNAIIIPIDYFEEKNRKKLIQIMKKAYLEKDKKIEYIFDKNLYKKYNELFK